MMEGTEKRHGKGALKGYFKRNMGTILALLLFILVISVSAPKFLTQSNLMNLLKSNSVNAIISCGMLLAILMGQIDISVGSTVGVTGVFAAFLITNAGLPVWAVILLCIVLGALIGTINGVSIAYLKVPAFVATLATMSIGRGLTKIISGGVSIRIRNDVYSAIGLTSFGELSIIIIYAVAAFIITWIMLNKTKFGHYLYAIGGNPVAAKYSGINVRKYNMIPYIAIGILCSIGGIIWSSRLGSAAATLGEGFELDAISAVVIGGTSMTGGVGTIGGTVIGILIIGVITNGLNLMGINAFWQDVIKGIIILLAVIIDILRKRN